MTVMADKGGKPHPHRPGADQKLAQAALNADVTVDQVDTILEGFGETLLDLNKSTGNLDATLVRFNETINQHQRTRAAAERGGRSSGSDRRPRRTHRRPR